MKLQDLLTTVEVGESKLIDLKDGKLTVELRKLHGEPPRDKVREESPRRSHAFHSAKSLADYLVRYGSGKTVVFADTEKEEVGAVVDETATKGFELLVMKPQVHPLWKPWAEKLGQPQEIDDFAAFVAENRRAIVHPDGREVRLLFSQIRCSVEKEIQRGRGKNALNGTMVKVKVEGSEANETVQLPDSLGLHVPLYVGTSAVDLVVDLTVQAGDDGIEVTVSSGTATEARVQAFEDMVAQVRQILLAGPQTKDAVVTFGRPQSMPWAYLPEIKAAKD